MPQFWDFALQIYARPAVAAHCRELQDQCGANVMLLLYCCWRARCGVRLACEDLQVAIMQVTPLQQHLVEPLRAARRALRAAATTTQLIELASAAERVQQSELRGEYLQAQVLERIAVADPLPAQIGWRELASDALALYLRLIGVDAHRALRGSAQLARDSTVGMVSA